MDSSIPPQSQWNVTQNPLRIVGALISLVYYPEGPSTPYYRTLRSFHVAKTMNKDYLDPSGYGNPI